MLVRTNGGVPAHRGSIVAPSCSSSFPFFGIYFILFVILCHKHCYQARVNTLFPPLPPSLLHPLRTLPFCVQCGAQTGVKRESRHANTVCMPSPLLAMWPPPVRAPTTCAGAPCSLPLPHAGFVPCLCAQTGCVGTQKVRTPPLFATRSHSSDKTTSAGLAAAPPSRPCFTNRGIACTSTGHGKPARGTTPAPCVPLMHASGAHERGWAATRAGAVPPLLPPCPRKWGAEKAAPPFAHGPEAAREQGQ